MERQLPRASSSLVPQRAFVETTQSCQLFGPSLSTGAGVVGAMAAGVFGAGVTWGSTGGSPVGEEKGAGIGVGVGVGSTGAGVTP